MKEMERIKIEQADMSYMQRLTYEVNSRKDVIATMIENHAADTDDRVLSSPAFITYHDQLSKLYAEYEIAKTEFAAAHLPEKYRDMANAVWMLDFSTGEMIIRG